MLHKILSSCFAILIATFDNTCPFSLVSLLLPTRGKLLIAQVHFEVLILLGLEELCCMFVETAGSIFRLNLRVRILRANHLLSHLVMLQRSVVLHDIAGSARQKSVNILEQVLS